MTRLVMEAGREEQIAIATLVENAVEQTLRNMQQAIGKLHNESHVIAMAVKRAEKEHKVKLDPNDPMDRQL